MSKLCMFTQKLGIKCSGSDSNNSDNIRLLKFYNIPITIGEDIIRAKNADLVVYSSAIPSDSRELMVAKRKIERKEYLKYVSNLFSSMIAISGTHGKTTTSSMLSWIFKCSGEKFTAHIGGEIVGTNFMSLSSGYDTLITEACEYKKSFLELSPTLAVILNVDFDHPDCYKDINDVNLAFSIFAKKSKKVIYNNECESLDKLLKLSDKKAISYGILNADYTLGEVSQNGNNINFEVLRYGKSLGVFTIYSYNPIYVMCALAVVATCLEYGININDIRIGLATFPGVKERFECLGRMKCGARVIRDYAHHPKEIMTVINAGRNLVGDKLITVFMPHTYSRTKALFDDFVQVLKSSDTVIILPTYKAREIAVDGVDSIELYDRLCKVMDNVVYAGSVLDAKEWINKNADMKTNVLAIGAGLNVDIFIEK